MTISVHAQTGVLFEMQVYNAVTHKLVRKTPQFKNLVLDAGLYAALSKDNSGSILYYLSVGTGSSMPTVNQTTLDSRVATTSNRTSLGGGLNKDDPESPYLFYRYVFRFNAGQLNHNISELGLGWNSDGALWNRALVKNTDGEPTTITVLSDEYLDVICEWRVYLLPHQQVTLPLLDKNGLEISRHTANIYPHVMGTITSKPYFRQDMYMYIGFAENSMGINDSFSQNGSGHSAIGGDVINNGNGTYTRIFTIKLGLDVLNGNHTSLLIVGLPFGEYSYYQGHGYKMNITPPIVKKNTQEMIYKFALTIGRYEGDV